MARYLDEIVAWHRARVAADGRDAGALRRAAAEAARSDPPRPFEAALRADPAVSVIGEVKRRSPSRGDLAPDLDPAAVALDYERGGASCLSVLTDGPHFGGDAADLAAARAATRLPVLRKDFTVAALDVLDARIMGADAVLLIAAVLTDEELSELTALARELEMAALVEVHEEAEAERAVRAGASLVGVNQRDLRTFEVDRDRARRVARVLDRSATLVAESGIRGRDDVAALAEAGYDAVLVGETLVRAADHAAALRSLTGVPTATRAGRCG